jgi:glucose-1-phosphate thymidylyltransferase
MKGIILAGGSGSRLYPSTQVVSKQLLPIYSSPLIYYTLNFVMDSGIKDICVITNTENVDIFQRLLGDGSQWGINIEIRPQEKPNGIAEAFIIAEDFIRGSNCLLLLGDNMFYGYNKLSCDIKNFQETNEGAMIYGYHVHDPERYGVIEFGDQGEVISLEEKPEFPKSHYASVGLYICDSTASERARDLTPSDRGELEITDLLKTYLEEDLLYCKMFKKGVVWLDAGTTDSLAEASNFVETIEKRTGEKIACPEETAYRNKFISKKDLRRLVDDVPNSEYKRYLMSIL